MSDLFHDLLVTCDCKVPEHQLIFSYIPEENELDEFIYVQIHLSDRSFWNRLIGGIRYIFGHKSKYGDWDEVLMNPQTARKLRDFINEFLETSNE